MNKNNKTKNVKRFTLSVATCCSAQYANNLKIYRLLLGWLAGWLLLLPAGHHLVARTALSLSGMRVSWLIIFYELNCLFGLA